MKNRAPQGVLFHPDLPAMRFDDGARYRQSDTHAVAFRSHEGLKQLFGNLGRDPRASVNYADANKTFVGRCDGDREITDLRGFHRIHGVADQVEKHLLDLYAIGQHQVDRWIELKLYTDAAILDAHQGEGARFFDQLADAFRAALGLATRNEVTQATNDLTCAHGLIGCLIECAPYRRCILIAATFEKVSRAFEKIGRAHV